MKKLQFLGVLAPAALAAALVLSLSVFGCKTDDDPVYTPSGPTTTALEGYWDNDSALTRPDLEFEGYSLIVDNGVHAAKGTFTYNDVTGVVVFTLTHMDVGGTWTTFSSSGGTGGAVSFSANVTGTILTIWNAAVVTAGTGTVGTTYGASAGFADLLGGGSTVTYTLIP
jgi:hypothetical protein